MNKTDQLIERWRSAGPITWAEGPYRWIGIDIFDANTCLYVSRDKLRKGAIDNPYVRIYNSF